MASRENRGLVSGSSSRADPVGLACRGPPLLSGPAPRCGSAPRGGLGLYSESLPRGASEPPTGSVPQTELAPLAGREVVGGYEGLSPRAGAPWGESMPLGEMWLPGDKAPLGELVPRGLKVAPS